VSSRALLNNPAVFYSAFVGELRRHGRPEYPDRRWFQSLALAVEADELALRQLERHRCDAALYERRYEQWLAPAARSRAARQLDTACTRFLESRGIPAGDFHAY
jgi:hypothetical protein